MVRLGFVMNNFGNKLLKLTFLLSLDFVPVRGICDTRNSTETLTPYLLSSRLPIVVQVRDKGAVVPLLVLRNPV